MNTRTSLITTKDPYLFQTMRHIHRMEEITIHRLMTILMIFLERYHNKKKDLKWGDLIQQYLIKSSVLFLKIFLLLTGVTFVQELTKGSPMFNQIHKTLGECISFKSIYLHRYYYILILFQETTEAATNDDSGKERATPSWEKANRINEV